MLNPADLWMLTDWDSGDPIIIGQEVDHTTIGPGRAFFVASGRVAGVVADAQGIRVIIDPDNGDAPFAVDRLGTYPVSYR